MPTFDINTYDLLQRAISTAEALHELGTEERDAAFEAAETVLDDREDTISDQAYITEAVAATGPPVDTTVVDDQFTHSLTDDTVEAAITALLEAVLTSATYTDAFDARVVHELDRPNEPQDSYDAAPEDLLTIFRDDATGFFENGGVTNADDPFLEAAERVLDKHDELETLPYTAIALVLEHLVIEHDADQLVADYGLGDSIAGVSVTATTTLTDLALEFLTVLLAAYFRETLAVEAGV